MARKKPRNVKEPSVLDYRRGDARLKTAPQVEEVAGEKGYEGIE
jgi:hypothetical protein